jgi:hypothetical protein
MLERERDTFPMTTQSTTSAHRTFYLHCWDEASRRLDRVPSHDYDRAYRAAYSGCWSLTTRGNSIAAAQLDGCSAALAVWVQVQGIW